MNIVLIGYRGTGKSAVGRLVAARLGLEYVSTDELVVARAGCPIAELVARAGWPAFRDLESAVAQDVARQDHLLIDTGGGMIERPENIAALQANGCLIWLQASVAVIVARIQDDSGRPALTGGQSFTAEVAEVLARRTPLYQAAAHAAIDTDLLTPEAIAAQVIALCSPAPA